MAEKREGGNNGDDKNLIADSGGATNEDEDIVCMDDVIAHADALEQDANLVLGGSDAKNCTYGEGYVSRQALYACETCMPGEEMAGICLACSLQCHDGHNLYELYTKRLFKCDCGNSKFKQPCKLSPEKEALNVNNKYNHNFKGLYCVCNKPYPDEDEDEDEDDDMIQCCLCEDWLHGRHLGQHLGSAIPENYHEMTCASCIAQHSFLKFYHFDSLEGIGEKSTSLDEEDEVNVVDETTASGSKTENTTAANGTTSVIAGAEDGSSDRRDGCSKETDSKVTDQTTSQDVSELTAPSVEVTDKPGSEPKSEAEVTEITKSAEVSKTVEPADVSESTNAALSTNGSSKPEQNNECILAALKKNTPVKEENTAAFWQEDWRLKLCRCSDCVELYKVEDLEFLLDPDDPTHVYELKSQQSVSDEPTLYEQGMSALNTLDRVQQVEMVQGYNEMKAGLREYLSKFAQNSKVVRAEDIKEFFEEYKKNKKMKPSIPSSSCK